MKVAGLEEEQIVVTFIPHLAHVLTARSFYNQNQAVIHGHSDQVPFSIVDWAWVNNLQYRPGLHPGLNRASDKLQGGKVLSSAPVVQHYVWQSALESELHVELIVGFSLCPVFGNRQLHVHIALRIEGECGGGVAAIPAPARRTLAVVAVLSIVSQHRDTACSMLALILLAANQTDFTVSPTPRLQARFWYRAVTPIGVGSICARGTILAGTAITLVNVHLTVYSCVGRQACLVLKHT